MVGIARALTDFSYCTYLSDLAVRESHQRSGIGRELLRLIREAGGPDAQLILLSAPDAVDYYPHLGFIRHESAWVWPPEVETQRRRPGHEPQWSGGIGRWPMSSARPAFGVGACRA